MTRSVLRPFAILMATLVLAACSSGGGATAAPSSAAPSTAPSAAPSDAASPGASAGAGGAYEIKTSTAASITGSFLTGADGKTLYIFKKDTQGDGKSTCSGQCATNWPPFTVESGEAATAGEGVTASKISTITRDDGTTQVVYDGWPLYYYAPDTAAGDVKGEGVGNVWFVATP